MANNIKLYTFAAMEEAHAHNSPSEASGHIIEMALDNNPDTWWQPTSTSNVEIEIDLESTHAVDTLILFIRNYTTLTNTPTQVQVDLSYSDDGSAWTACTEPTDKAIGGLTAGPLRIESITTGNGVSHRYWKVGITDQNEVIELAGLWLANEYDLGQGDEWPEYDEDVFHTRIAKIGGGRQVTSRINRRSHKILSRRFHFYNSTTFGYLRSAHQDSWGEGTPLILQEGSTYDDALLVKFGSDIINQRQYQDELYRPIVIFEELPYIDDGDLY